ncbi:hypothetical protein [Maribellus comscasis]|uniref:hypothetical protein n=1 Tax=Maribellus comscasis TaxID=2681766 RepID=UPI001C2D0E2C|nr:hypothetical protein [Maribellus comscasis]
MKKSFDRFLVCSLLLAFVLLTLTLTAQEIRQAPAPLFRDPVYDGAADPVVFWNNYEKEWWMFYTARRANADAADVAYCFGTNIGIASSGDNGKSWVYRGELDLDFENGKNTFWAPDVVYFSGKYHLFVTYKKGVRNHWGGKSSIAHYTSENAWDWKIEGMLSLSSEDVIDGTLFQQEDGTWKMWYKDNSQSWLAESDDLYSWEWRKNPVIADKPHEGPIIFEFEGYYWLITDEWAGMGVYRSNDLENWEKQSYPILNQPSSRTEDKPSGAHGDVVVIDNNAIYFTSLIREGSSILKLNSMKMEYCLIPCVVLPFRLQN